MKLFIQMHLYAECYFGTIVSDTDWSDKLVNYTSICVAFHCKCQILGVLDNYVGLIEC